MNEPKFEPIPKQLIIDVLDDFRVKHNITPLLKELALNKAKKPVKARIRRVYYG
jgi:hypothetical protein